MVGAVDHFKSILEARVAGKMSFDVIDHVPGVKENEEGTEVVTDMKGRIEFKNVSFKYPTKQDMTVLDCFNCVFEEGKTTALVGPSGSGKSTII